jgi:disulfide bond formation protein DsbB
MNLPCSILSYIRLVGFLAEYFAILMPGWAVILNLLILLINLRMTFFGVKKGKSVECLNKPTL